MRNHLTVLIALAAVALVPARLPAQGARRAPGFSLPDSRMELHDLADYRGKPVILEFMQTSCPHCQLLAGILEGLHEKYGDRLAILSVANPPDNQTKVAQFIAEHKVSYPIVFDCGQAAYSYLRVQSFNLPQVFLIDPQGMIRNQFSYGPGTLAIFEGNGLEAEVERLLPHSDGPKK
jgi:peroxiredoxin